MKKSHILLVLIILLCMIPLCTALAASGTVTVSALNIRAKASADSNVVGVLHQGDKVTIQETSGSWYKITGNGRTGYVARKYVSISSGSSSGSNTSKSSSSGGTCAPGDKGDAVRKIQNRLIALGYLPSGSADGAYGNQTKNAVIAFQKNNGLYQTGIVNANTLNKLNSSGAKKAGSNSSVSSNGTCAPGDKGDAVRKIQYRLIALGYLPNGSADGDYGNKTKTAVIAFQKNNGLYQTGIVNANTLTKLNSSGAKKASSGSSNGTCAPGDKGDTVRKVQRRLVALGYLSNGSVDGDYGNQTKKAVQAFQRQNGLSQTGTVNSATLNKLNSSSAKKAGTSASKGTERLNWFNGGKNIIPKGATFKVKDIWTGRVFTARRWSGYNHMDSEPLTRSDTNTLKSIYGHWSWNRRPILVSFNGHVYAASMNGMPHGTSTISGNGFDGHFCIHFYGSKTHGSQKVDQAHQNCVAIAMNYSW